MPVRNDPKPSPRPASASVQRPAPAAPRPAASSTPPSTTPASSAPASSAPASTASASTARPDGKAQAPGLNAATQLGRVAGPAPSRGLESLDALWTQGRHAELVAHIAEHVAQLEGRDFKGLDAGTLYNLAGQLFVLEARTGTLLNKLSLTTDKAAALQALETQRRIAGVQTAVFRRAVELQDSSTPTPVGQWVVFRDTQKKPGFHTPTAQEQYYVDKVRKFIQAGGDPTQVATLDAGFLKSLPSGQLCEYVVDACDVARAATVVEGRPSPGHTVLARGGDALTAGTFTAQKNERGDITQVLVGTFSGHFRSGVEAQHHLVRHLVAAGVAPELIVQREGQAGNPRTQEILGRILGLEGPEAQRREQAMLAEAYRWDEPALTSPGGAADDAARGGGAAAGTPKAQTSESTRARAAVGDALQAMRVSVANALVDGALLSTQMNPDGLSEVDEVVKSIDAVLVAASAAGNIVADGQARALLRHLASLGDPHVDAAAADKLKALQARWDATSFGASYDPVSIFSRAPARDRRARIVATVNPKATDVQLREMISAGMDVARFNTAHGSTDEQVALMQRIRAAAASLGRDVSIQIDLEGPKIRLGRFENPQQLEFNDIPLKEGETVTLTTHDVLGNPRLFPVEFPTLCDDLQPGEPVFMNDGTVELRVVSVDKAAGTVEAEVVTGGKVWDRKGINLPQTELSVRTITDEDLSNLEALLPHVDLVASSFVGEAEDVLFLRRRMEQLGRVVPIIAKIERKEGIENLTQIALVADALMVARGDLGVEIGYENVPGAERRINAVGKLYGKPTMVATEVLMSMVKDPSRPSRGDVEGLYAAIHDRGADAIMLGKETSFPQHPAEVIRAASRVIEKAEEERARGPYTDAFDASAQRGGLAAGAARLPRTVDGRVGP